MHRWADAAPLRQIKDKSAHEKGRGRMSPAFDSLFTSDSGITYRNKELVLHMMVQLEHSKALGHSMCCLGDG